MHSGRVPVQGHQEGDGGVRVNERCLVMFELGKHSADVEVRARGGDRRICEAEVCTSVK